MAITQTIHTIKEKLKYLCSPWLGKIDIPFLVLLLMTVNYRYSLKIAALIIAYSLRPNFKFQKSKINYFFLGMIGIGLLNFIISGNYQFNHFTSVSSGFLIWITCILVFHQVNLSVQTTPTYKLLNSIRIIVLLNFIISLTDIAGVAYTVSSLNPYTSLYPPPYGIMSGDLVGGIFGGMHLANTCISAITFVVFLKKKDFIFALFSLLSLLLTSSNLATLFILLGLVFLLILKKDKLIKYFSLSFIAIIILFYSVINTSNLYLAIGMIKPQISETYFQEETNKILNHNDNSQHALMDSLKTDWRIEREDSTGIQEKEEDSNKTQNISEGVQEKHIEKKRENLQKSWNYNDKEQQVKDSILADTTNTIKMFDIEKTPGAIISYIQTKYFVTSSPKKLLLGAGTNEFSSRLAFVNSRTVDDSRVFTLIPRYESEVFTNNHKALFEYLMFAGEETHSIIHLPFSGYNQIIGEYGVIGLLFFIFLYLGNFFFQWNKLTYGRLILLLIIPLFAFEYWHERLSVMVIFEMILLLNLKENTEIQKQNTNETP